MTSLEQRLVAILVEYERCFVSATRQARSRQGEVVAGKKLTTGEAAVDVVTPVDMETQETILLPLSRTLVGRCRLQAEEGTSSVGLFTGELPYTLAVDPLDNTAKYVRGGTLFSSIVALYSNIQPLYTFIYYPAHCWGMRMVGDEVCTLGIGSLELGVSPTTGIVEDFGGEGFQRNRTLQWRLTTGHLVVGDYDITNPDNPGALELLLGGCVGGYCVSNPGAEDGLVAYHYAKVYGYRCWPAKRLRLTQARPGTYGWCYPGFYLVVRP